MKLVKKLFPVNIYDIVATESYLKDMAAEGLFFKKLGIFAYFEKAEPEKVTYRLGPLTKAEKKPSEEILEDYKRYGWEYVCTIAKLFHVYISKEKQPTEIHTDPITQGYTYEYLNKKLKFSAILCGVLLCLSIVMILYAVLFNDQPVLFAVKYGQSAYQSLMVIFGVFSIYQTARGSIKIKKLITSLQEGISITHKKSYKKVIIIMFYLASL